MKVRIVIAALIIINLILLYVVIYRKPEKEFVLFDDKPYRDSIQNALETAEYWRNEAYRIEADRDLLQIQKQKVKYFYEPIYIFNSGASVTQLDSVLRANW